MEVNEEEIARYLPGVSKKLEWLSETDLLKRVLSLEFNRLLAYYRDMPDIDLNEKDKPAKEKRGKRDKDRRDAEQGYERLVVNIGKGSGFYPGNLMELINRNVRGAKPEVGRIDLMPGYTLFDVRRDDAPRVIAAMKNVDFFGVKIRCERATDRDYAADSDSRRPKAKGKRKDKAGKREKGLNKEFFTDADVALKPEKAKKKAKACLLYTSDAADER